MNYLRSETILMLFPAIVVEIGIGKNTPRAPRRGAMIQIPKRKEEKGEEI